ARPMTSASSHTDKCGTIGGFTSGSARMLIRTCIVSGILLGLAGLAFTQQKPDFSGTWTLNRQASTLSPGAAAVQSGIVRIEHRDPTFRYKAAFVSANGPVEYEYELRSDGRDAGSVYNGVTTVSNLRWEGEALVVRSRIERPDGETRISFRYELM